MRIKIASVGEPVLRDPARPLRPEEIGSETIRELIEHMRETLADAPGGPSDWGALATRDH